MQTLQRTTGTCRPVTRDYLAVSSYSGRLLGSLPLIQRITMMEAKYYAGVGSRETPLHICKFMTEVARYMETQGWTLRSGGARGADKAFAAGAENKQIFLPYQGWNGNQSEFFEPSAGAWELAPKFHPNWGACLRSNYKYTPDLMARNGHQVLGPDLETPSRLIICWTPGGSGDGGTGQAIRIARHYGVPIYDLGNPQERAKIERKIGVLCAGSVTTQRSTMKIGEFTGEWRFLSNFYASPLTIEGITYPTVEHAFQAGKTLNVDQRLAVSKCRTAAEAKRMGRTVTMRADWDTARVKVMTRLVGLKFRDPQLRAQLLATGDTELVEGNAWNDTFWGVCRGRGENHLGKILMQIRDYYRTSGG